MITRFAPSPTGLMHLGHVLAARFAQAQARAAGGRYLVRIEDIDPTRCRPEFTARILADLDWLELASDGPVIRQSDRFGLYAQALDKLRGADLLYPCFCTRGDIAAAIAAAHGPAAIYPGTCRNLPPTEAEARIAAGRPYALRLNTARALTETGPLAFTDLIHGPRRCTPEAQGDVVLARKDIPASYHLCVTQDDAEQGVTLVTRGEDLLEATDIHRLLQALMGWPEPLYAHHGLITDEQGKRLAKRDHAPTLRAMRASGMSPAEVRAAAGFP